MDKVPEGAGPVLRIDPTALYSKEDLRDLLGDRVGVETFLVRLRPVRRFKNLYWGQDLLDALSCCPPLDEDRQPEGPAIPQRKEVKRHAQDHQNKDRLRLSEVREQRE